MAVMTSPALDAVRARMAEASGKEFAMLRLALGFAKEIPDNALFLRYGRTPMLVRGWCTTPLARTDYHPDLNQRAWKVVAKVDDRFREFAAALITRAEEFAASLPPEPLTEEGFARNKALVKGFLAEVETVIRTLQAEWIATHRRA
jgi:hypothetical protein